MSETVELIQNLPYYLRDFFTEDMKCRIVILKQQQTMRTTPKSEKNESISDLQNSVEEDVTIELDSQTNIHDFIQKNREQPKQKGIVEGMLQIDLDDNSLEQMVKSPKHQCPVFVQPTTDEFHFPIDEQWARALLTTKYNCEKSSEPTLCIVRSPSDVKSAPRLVVLGGQNSDNFVVSYSIHTYSVPSAEKDSLTWEILKKIVRNQPRSSAEYTFRRFYNIYGAEMKDNDDIAEHVAAMILETCWNRPLEDEPNVVEASMNLKMQVVSGHPNSTIHFLWRELKNLETYLEVLENESALQEGHTMLSEEHIAASELAESIHNLCNSLATTKKHPSLHLLEKNLRKFTILDRLWSILIRCKDLIDLKNSLSTFFRAAKTENLSDRDRAVELVRDLNIQDYAANLTLAESLKFLFAIGCEKLKNDHLAVVSNFNPTHQVALEKIWSDYCDVKPPEMPRKSLAPLKSRKSLAPNQQRYFPLTDTSFNKEKMSLLCKLHDASEFVIFMKENMGKALEISNYNFIKISNEVYQRLVFDQKRILSSEPLAPDVVSITCDLDSQNEDLYKNQTPVKKVYETKLTINSDKTYKDESVCTILVSKSPIFPKCIYDCSPIKSTDDQKPIPALEKDYSVAILRKTKYGFY